MIKRGVKEDFFFGAGIVPKALSVPGVRLLLSRDQWIPKQRADHLHK